MKRYRIKVEAAFRVAFQGDGTPRREPMFLRSPSPICQTQRSGLPTVQHSRPESSGLVGLTG
jgi:hypothetical protein